ncbi:MAG: MBL fold metallo-hydrolase [Deltaproteobacteria bacterium]|nr:MBL fold metallo-hydrolase [Candidatus Zymogenaceae bacterium]
MKTIKRQDYVRHEAASFGKTGAIQWCRVSTVVAFSAMAVFILVLGTMLMGCAEVPTDNTVKSVKVGFTNIYFIPCTGGWLQIDCGYPGDYEKYLTEAGKIGIDPADVKYLLLTHHHDDHAGFAAEFVKNHNPVVIVHEKALGPLAAGASVEDMRPVNGCVKTVFSVFSGFHEFVFPPFVPRETDLVIGVDNGDILRRIGVNGVILSTPGHTDDSISVVTADGSAFAGDVAMNFFGVCGIQHRPIYIKDIDQVYASWERLQEFGAVTIYPSHGDPFPASELVPAQ